MTKNKAEETIGPEEQFGSMIYLDSFTLNTDGRAVYPYKVVASLGLRQIEFAPITILYGGIGSDKSTLLNIIADKIGVKNKSTEKGMVEKPGDMSSSERYFLSRCADARAAFFADSISDMFESNGEVALRRMQIMIMPDNLLFLDEPEVSLSPVYQRQLADMIELFASQLRTQFVIATHSPFFLSLKEARIYDLDSRPSSIRQWYELPNMHAFFYLFESN